MNKLKVVIPTDFSILAEYAYLMVKKLEEKIEIEIHFLHVMDIPDTIEIDDEGNIETDGEISVSHIKSQKEISERKLAYYKEHYGTDVSTDLRFGKVTDKIIEFASENNFDLIVMGTKGSQGIEEKISRTETQMIARRSPIPVLSLMCDRSDLSIEHILLVHNFANPKNENLGLLKKLLQVFSPTLHLLQIIKDETEKVKITLEMDEFLRLNQLDKHEKHFIKDTDVENGVIHFNQMKNMDIICIGTHGKGGFFHHSATEALINHLYKPIISFHLNN